MKELPPDITILENFIPPLFADKIENLFYNRDDGSEGITGPCENNIKWQYHHNQAINPLDTTHTWHDHPSNDLSGWVFTALTCRAPTEFITPDAATANYLFPLLYCALYADNPNQKLLSCYRIRIVMNVRQAFKGRTCPHRDLQFAHRTMVYYVNDSDGPTVVFDNKMNDIVEVEPKKGRAIIMGGHRYHCGTVPEKTKERFVINFNFKTTLPK